MSDLHKVESALYVFRYQKGLGEKAMGQMSDEELFRVFAPGLNSIAVIVRHLSGNMKSRWTNFLDEDGEKPWRNRDQEFEDLENSDRDSLLQLWEDGWNVLFRCLESLSESDLERSVLIRDREHSVTEAIDRQLAHYAYHIGQIVLIARLIKGNEWKTLSIAPGKSGEYRPGEKF